MREFNEERIKEAEKIVEIFEAKLEIFNKDVKSDNPIQVILKGHLYIEHELRELLEKNLKNPYVLEWHKLSFSQIAKLVFSLGLLPMELFKTIMEINKIRNRYSHNLDFKFELQEYNNLEKTFSAEFKEYYEMFLKQHTNHNCELVKLQIVLFTIWEQISAYNIMPDNFRQWLDEYKGK